MKTKKLPKDGATWPCTFIPLKGHQTGQTCDKLAERGIANIDDWTEIQHHMRNKATFMRAMCPQHLEYVGNMFDGLHDQIRTERNLNPNGS